MRAFAPVALFLGAFATLAAAQGGDTPTATSPADAAQTSALSAMVACIAACPAGDVDCQAKCITVPSPSQQQANNTIDCVAKCPQGTGSEADNLNYRNCVDACIARFYYTPSQGTPNPTGGAGSGSGSGSGGSGGSASGTATTTAGEATNTSASAGAADAVRVAGGSALGMLGFMAALLAI